LRYADRNAIVKKRKTKKQLIIIKNFPLVGPEKNGEISEMSKCKSIAKGRKNNLKFWGYIAIVKITQ
jgi:hypothetical protein